jgi:spore germination protein PB
MRFYIQQDISIPNVSVDSVTTSSVFQIGNTARILMLSNLFNTGEFTGPAPLSSYEIENIYPVKKEVIEGEGLSFRDRGTKKA